MNIKENLAFVFPGQGSQKVGMLSDFGDTDILQSTFREASDALGYDLWATVLEGPQEKLNLTEITQPLLLTASIALWRIWQDKKGVIPSLLAGHSLGEWSALVASEVIEFSSAVTLVRSRGKYMQEAVSPGEGAMAAIIGLEDEAVEKICAEFSGAEEVSAVNYNSPGQLVIAGHAQAVANAITACKEAGAKKAMSLAVSAPFHTGLMKPAAEKLSAEISETVFNEPKIPVVHNVHAVPESDAEKIKRIMIEQIYQPVKWVSCVQYFSENGIENVVECGPGKVLCGLNRRINKSLNSYATDSISVLDSSIDAVK